MPRNTSVILGEYFTEFIVAKIEEGRFESTSEAVRAGLRLLEAEETKLDLLRVHLAEGEAELRNGNIVDGEEFFGRLLG